MQLEELRGAYDAVFSLGQNCTPAIQMEKNGLRPFAGVLDWMMSDTLTDVNRLLRDRFAGFMEFPNLVVTGKSQLNYMVKDTAYNVISVHDFPQSRNTPSNLATYPEFKEKMERRIQRFHEKVAAARRVLFVRMLGTKEEVTELNEILGQLVSREYRLIIINYSASSELLEMDWQLPNVCALEMPYADIWNYRSDPHWSRIFQGIELSAE